MHVTTIVTTNLNNICLLFLSIAGLERYWPIAVDYISKRVSPAVDTVYGKIETIWRWFYDRNRKIRLPGISEI
jgi:hypothetical protein